MLVDNQKAQVLVRFDEIENNILYLLDKANKLETKNKELNQKVLWLEKELEEKVEAENKFSEEKALIRKKVDGLLEKIDAFAVPA